MTPRLNIRHHSMDPGTNFWRSFFFKRRTITSVCKTSARVLHDACSGTAVETNSNRRRNVTEVLQYTSIFGRIATRSIDPHWKKKSQREKITGRCANLQKVMMGPMAAIGDSFFWSSCGPLQPSGPSWNPQRFVVGPVSSWFCLMGAILVSESTALLPVIVMAMECANASMIGFGSIRRANPLLAALFVGATAILSDQTAHSPRR